jgi:DNA polymerase III epsilon subunit family exonuclease
MNSWQATIEDLGRPLVRTTFVVLDLETSGGAPHLGTNITEIGAVKVRGGEVLGQFQTFINPQAPIPSFITALTGITDEMVSSSPRIAEVFPILLEFLGSERETVFVAHNAPFDLSFLKAAAKASEYRWPKFTVIDTAKLARKVLSRDEVINCKLGTLAEFFNTSVSPTHRALDDALATVDVLHALIGRVGSLGITTLEELKDFSTRKSTVRSKKELDSI